MLNLVLTGAYSSFSWSPERRQEARNIMKRYDGLHSDFVDRLEEEWRKKRFGFSALPLAISARIQRAAFYLEAEIGRLAAESGLNAREFMALSALWRSGPPFALNPMQLLEEYLIPAATLTRQIDRLESLGLVERKSDPNDRRAVLVQLTPRGHAVCDDIVIQQRTSQMVIERLGRMELKSLNRLLHTLLLMFEEETTLRSARPPSRRGNGLEQSKGTVARRPRAVAGSKHRSIGKVSSKPAITIKKD